ncbi:AMP-binding protein [Bradyrhizobium yuanmingense]|uniref:class I adenylate-forming enzyme family protein n=1 Tax=Bradyrhizobium yuanmingense TaxID=108015 RepID=UPI0012FA7978|nr:class I adenylate-forming enzyme family protein [Bradyrhizobium yuanmingense]MVT55968.1 AMP-binding protein [Bradyrhizobium yuanmingense]
MTPTISTPSQLHDGVANALRAIEALESAYETITVAQLVSMRARTHGSTIAIDIFERGERATYSEMDRRSDQCARALRCFGVRKGDHVAAMLPNRIEFPILWFACAKLGAVLVAINMRYTSNELEYVLSDAQAKFAIVDESVWPVLSAMDPWPHSLVKERVIVVGQPSNRAATTLDELLKGVDESEATVDVRPDDLLNIQYTSGTTGVPKGCMLTHDYWGVQSYVYAHEDRQPYKTYLCWWPLFYVDGLVTLLRSYRQGGTLYVAQQLDLRHFVSWLKMYRIEWCALPKLILEAADLGSTYLKEVWQSGAWTAETIRRCREHFGVRVQSPYGMTEIGCGTTLITHERDELAGWGSVGIRAPFRALQLINEDGSPTPVGETGELWVRGRGIFNGYWNKPHANALSFEGEWFKTGDLFRCDALGFHWVVGRKADTIRRSGDNIPAREVEAVIRELPEVAEVAAVPVRDEGRGEEIKICVQLKEGVTPGDLPVERILEHALSRLAMFKVPRYIAFTPALPRTTSSNKVVKHELMNVADPLAGSYDCQEKRWR